jgi:hypothetical protein
MPKPAKITPFIYLDSDLEFSWEDDSPWEELLNEAAPLIGLIIIFFNSLEDQINTYICEILSHSEGKDELIYTFLAEMGYSQKVTILTRLYGQMIREFEDSEDMLDQLSALEATLRNAGTARNQYAHADWTGISSKKFIRVKTKAKKQGVEHTFIRFSKEDMKSDLKQIEEIPHQMETFNNSVWDTLQSN